MEAGGQAGGQARAEMENKRWVVLVENGEGKMEEWDLVEESLHRIQDPLDVDDGEEERGD